MPHSDDVRDRSPDRKDRTRRVGGGSAGRGKQSGGSSNRRAPAERRIFLSNIPFETRWQEVKDLFRENVGEVVYVEMFNDEQDKPRGCGIIEFANESLAKTAVEKMHRHDFKGRKLVVKEDFDFERDKHGRITRNRRTGGDDRGTDRRDRGSSSGGGNYGNSYGLSPQFLDSLGIDGPLHTRLFVANLSYTVDERKLRDVFRLAGRVVLVELNRDKEGKSRGHAVIEYDHPVEAVQAISMFNDQLLYDRKMTVRFDKEPGPTPEELAQLPSRLPEGLGGVGMGLGSEGNPLTEVPKNLPSASNSSANNNPGSNNPMQGTGGPNGPGSINMNDLTTLSNTLALARQLGMAGALNNMAAMGNMGNMGGGMGGMADNGMGNNSMSSMGGMNTMGGGSMGGGSMGGGPMGDGPGNRSMGMSGLMGDGPGARSMGGSMMADNSGGRSMGGASLMGDGPGGRSMAGGSLMGDGPGSHSMDMGRGGYSTSMNMGSGGYGSTSRISDTAGRTSQASSDSIIVRNLPLDCNWQVLREQFQHCGEIKYAEMKERGIGLIRFTSDRDAERAMSMMNNEVVANRRIDVRLY